MRQLPSRISNAHGERLLDDITQARIDERRRLAKKLNEGPGQEIQAVVNLAMEMHGSLISESHPLAEKMGHLAEEMEQVIDNLQALVKFLDPSFRDTSPWAASEQKSALMQPHGHPYRILGQRLPEGDTPSPGRRLFAL